MAVFLVLLFFLVCLPLRAQEWPYFGADAGGTKYSPLKQINRGNVGSLRVAWTYHTGDVSDGKTYLVRSAFEGTPLAADGVMYLTTPFCRLVALEAETGRELWAFDPKIDRERSHNLFINRGATFSPGTILRLFFAMLSCMGKWCTVTILDGVGKRYSLDVHADSSYDAAHLYLTHVRGNPGCGLPIPTTSTVFEVIADGRIHRVPGSRLKKWIEKRREEWKGPRGMLFHQRPMIGD